MLSLVLPIDKIIIIQTFTMARWEIVVKTSEATKQTKDQNDNKNQPNKQTKTKTKQTKKRAEGVEKQLNERSSDVDIIIDLRETERGRGLKRVLLRLYPKQIWADFYRFTSGGSVLRDDKSPCIVVQWSVISDVFDVIMGVFGVITDVFVLVASLRLSLSSGM